MRVKNFKQFENNGIEFLSEDDINDLFIDLLDDDFQIKFFDTASRGSYFFELKKLLSYEQFDPIKKGSAYGITNISNIKNHLEFLNQLDEIKKRLNEMGYQIGFEFEFHFNSGHPMIYVVCHMQHEFEIIMTVDWEDHPQ